MIAYRRRQMGAYPLMYQQVQPVPPATDPALPEREVVSLRQAIAELQAQLHAARAVLPADSQAGTLEART